MKIAGNIRWFHWMLPVVAVQFALAEPEVRRAFPRSVTPGATTAAPSSSPAEVPSSGSSETIRLGPLTDSVAAARTQLEGANNLFVRKMYDLAIPEYEKFLNTYSQADGRDAAFFRLAESNRFLGHNDAARDGYLQLLQEFPSGQFTASAAYRLGEIFFGVQNYSGALSQFQLAAINAKEEGVRLSALFYQARCWDALGYKPKALEIYQELAMRASPFRDYCSMAVAQADADGGRRQAALERLDQVARTSQNSETQAEANVRAGALAITLKQMDAAAERFRKALSSREWQSTAWLGLLQIYYQKKEYQRIIAEKEKMVLAKNAQPEGLLLIGNAYRQLGHFKEAYQFYDRLIQEFPNSKPAEEARFQRLLALYSLGDPRLSDAVNTFQTADPFRRSQVLLLKAEVLFQKKQFAEAAPLFQGAYRSDLPTDLKANALYKLGWCYAHSEAIQPAITVYSQFIKTYPDHLLIPSAWLQRGLAKQQNKDNDAALSDFDTLIANFPKSQEREVALLQRALLLGARGDKAGLIQTFQRLLSEYPKTAAAAQANFWLGWAAYENQDYSAAVDYLNKARTLDKGKYQKRTALRILLAYYYLKNVEAASREATNVENIPDEIAHWLGMEAFRGNRFSEAIRYLQRLVKNSNNAEVYLALAEAQLKLEKYSAAISTVDDYLNNARDPASRAEGLLIKVQALKGEAKVEDALKLISEVQILQPEGVLNARARLIAGDLQMEKQNYSEAGKDYTAVAILYDDPKLALPALKGAIQAYRHANNAQGEEKALTLLRERFPNESTP